MSTTEIAILVFAQIGFLATFWAIGWLLAHPLAWLWIKLRKEDR